MNLEQAKVALQDYVEHGGPVGSFLTAVLQNDLLNAVNQADAEALAALKQIVAFVYWELPGPCWGSPQKVTAWRKRKQTINPKRETNE